MSDKTSVTRTSIGYGGFGLGVFWHAWTVHGFWWALLYGWFWPVWAGYRLALSLMH